MEVIDNNLRSQFDEKMRSKSEVMNKQRRVKIHMPDLRKDSINTHNLVPIDQK